MSAALVPELSVSDIGRSLEFYCHVLGFFVRYQRPAEGFAYVAMGEAELMLDQLGTGRDWVTAALEPPLGRGINIQIRLDDIEPVLTRLKVAGAVLFQPLEVATYTVSGAVVEQRQFCVQDPDGYLLRFCQSVP